jgi:hypothetical protein
LSWLRFSNIHGDGIARATVAKALNNANDLMALKSK